MKIHITKLFGIIYVITVVMANVPYAGASATIIQQLQTIDGTIGVPINLSYTPNYYVVTDPTGTIGVGFQPFATIGGSFLNVECNGSVTLSESENPGYNYLMLNPISGGANMNIGATVGLNMEFMAFGDTLTGQLNISQLPNNGDWGFYATNPFSSYLLQTPVTLGSTNSITLASVNGLDALSLWFGIVVPDWLADIGMDINADIGISQTVSGTGLNTSAGEFESESTPILVDVNGDSFQLQNISETFNDATTYSLGLEADLSASLLWGAVNVTLVNFGNLPLVAENQEYTVTSDPISNVSFNLTLFNVTASAGSGGAISPNGTTSVAAGGSLQLTASPLPGYIVGTWTVNGAPDQSGGGSFTLNNIQANATVNVTFISVGSRPSATTGAASNVGSTSATIGGKGNANGSSAYMWFIWGTTTSYGNQTVFGNQFPETEESIGSGTNYNGLSASLVNLSPGTVYHFELVCSNANGVTYGGDKTFTTLPNGSAPSIVRYGVSGINENGGYFNALVNSGDNAASWVLEYGPTTAYGTTISSSSLNLYLAAITNNIGLGPFQMNANPNQIVHYQFIVNNSVGSSSTGDNTYTTSGMAPSITSSSVTNITSSTVIVNAEINAGGLNTTGWVLFGTNIANMIPVSSFDAGSGNGAVNANSMLTNLIPAMNYFVQVLASNSVGPTYGQTVSFTTASPVPATLSISVVQESSAQITVVSQSGQLNILLMSTNLASWTPIYTNVGSFVFTFTNTYNYPYFFFQLRSP